MNDKLDGVSTFVQVVDAGSFTVAAERLQLTRSAVGKVITRLEARLGVRLLHRTTRSQTLTEAGQVYYDRCVRALAELDAAEADLESEQSEPRGTSASQCADCVRPSLRRTGVVFALAHRHAGLQIDISFTDRAVDLVEEGVDLAVRIGPLHDSATLAARRLGVQHLSIGAAPSYLARRGTPVELDDLDGHDGITYSRAGVLSPWRVREADGNVRNLRIEPRLSLDDIQAIAGAAIDGFGLAQLPAGC